MGTITSEGLAQEQRVLHELCTTYSSRLQLRGITPERLTDFTTTIAAMEKQRTDSGHVKTDKRDLTIQELQQCTTVIGNIKKIQQGAKNTFAEGSPQLKDFHIGEKLFVSTPLVIGWAKDLLENWESYKDQLTTKGGLIQADIDELRTAVTALEAADTAQELAKKKGAPEATAAFKAAVAAAKLAADALHGIAAVEFKNEPEILKQFELAKKLRYQQPPNNDNGTPPPTPPPPVK